VNIGPVIGARIGARVGPAMGSLASSTVALTLTHVASASAAATSVAIPTHMVGDVIIVTCRRGNTTPPSIPSAGGTVPTWVTVESGGADAVSLVTVMCIATATDTTTGTFTNAAQIIVSVLRPNKAAALGAHATGNAASTETIVFPALTRQSSDGICVRTATRAAADSEVANAPSGWTNRAVQPAAGSAVLCLHTQDAAGDPTADTVNTTGSAAAYRAHTFEIKAA